MHYQKPNRFFYWLTRTVAAIPAACIYQRRFLRNEIQGKQGPFVVIANHQSMLDFVNLIGATKRPMTFVISNSFYNSLPVKGIMDRIGVIPKQQFQTSVKYLKRMKEVIDRGEAFVIYPAGLMCEDGLSTPIPVATYKFLKWLGADVYVAKTVGSYFVMPKWGKGMRPGRTTMDIYKLFSAQELQALSIDQIRVQTDQALLFDAYKEQEQLQERYRGNRDIRGIENVLYLCPNCKKLHTIALQGKSTLYCTVCGFRHTVDAYGFLENTGDVGPTVRYISDWSRMIQAHTRQTIDSGSFHLETPVQIHMLQGKKFRPAGNGQLTLDDRQFRLTGTVNGQALTLQTEADTFPSLPFSPGKHLEYQHGNTIFRCIPEDGRYVMELINALKALYARSHETAPVK